jgi:DNA recombination protein Rad52
MTFSENQIGLLKAPLNSKHVKTRSQSGRTFSYVEAWHAIDEANRIFGFDAWTRETVEMRLVAEKPREVGQYKKPGFGVTYLAKVRVTVGGVWREGTGAGSGIDVDLGQAHESAAKEAESDAMKRALMTFGYTFGLALYDKDQANVIDENDRSAPKPPEVEQLSKGEARPEYMAIVREIQQQQTPVDLASWGAKNKARMLAMPSDWQDALRHEYADHKRSLEQRTAT